MSEQKRKERYDVQDFGIIGPENAVWLYCENSDAVNALRPGQTAFVDFKTGAGRNTVRVTRLNDEGE